MPELIINDTNYLQHHTFEDRSRGLIPRKPSDKMEYGEAADFDLIPRAEWPDRIADMEREKSRLTDICKSDDIPCLDQNGTNYCHANSPALAIMILRAVQGQPFVHLSPGSIGGPVTGFRNAGAWIGDDLDHIVKHGCASIDYVPANQVTRDGWKEGAEENALQHRVNEWWDLPRRSFDHMMTLLFLRIPVCTGHNWWRHAVTALDPVMVGRNKFGARFRNSWGPRYGDNGFFIMEEGKGTPDEHYAPRSIVAAD
jgi:hypothetical protein